MKDIRIIVAGLSPSLDRTITLESYLPGKTNIIKNTVTRAGGKATNVSFALKKFGMDFVSAGIIAGSNGEYIKKALEDKGIDTVFSHIEGETRVNYKIYCENTKTMTEMNDRGQPIAAEDAEDWTESMINMLGGCETLVLSGRLPPGFSGDTYARIIAAANRGNTKVILDTNGRSLKDSLGSKPYAVKPNRDELEEYAGRRLPSIKETAEVLRGIIDRGVSIAVVSLGKDGAIGADRDQMLYAESFDIIPAGTVGAGDSMVAALVYCLHNHMCFQDTLKWMVAYSTLTAAMGPGEYPGMEEAENALKYIKVKENFINSLQYL